MLIFLIFPILIRISQASDYCSMCPKGSHTMCLYNEGPSLDCIDYRPVVINDHVKQYIVDIHNDIRNHVASGLETKGKLGKQPPAANMMQMAWDEELATIAQRWADQCISIKGDPQHDICKKTDRFDQIGQNILTAVTNGTELPELAILILNWYKQVSNVIPSDVNFFSGVKRGQFLIGQYTQLVWANTRYVGCGMSIYKEPGSQYFNQRLVCNYAPGGNIIGQPIYKTGLPCSKCPTEHCDSFRTALCEGDNINLRLPKNLNRIFLKDWLGKEFNLCIKMPEDSLQQIYDCLNFSSKANNKIGNIRSDLIRMLIYRNMSLRENREFDKTILDSIPYYKKFTIVDFQPGLVINLTKGDYLNLMNNESYTKEMKSLIIQLVRNTSGSDEELLNKKGRYKRSIGKWYNGRCRCDKVYREGSNNKAHDKEIFTDSGLMLIPIPYFTIVSIVIIIFNME